MKKIILTFLVITIFLLGGLTTANSININGLVNNKTQMKNSEINLIEELANPSTVNSGGWEWYKNFIERQGIKIWASGYGTYNCIALDEESTYVEFLEGKKDGEVWKVKIWLPENYQQAQKNSYKYCFYNEEAETRLDSIICRHPSLLLLVEILFPHLIEKFRYNTKAPVEGTGPHEMFTWSYFFTGEVAKGKTFEGMIMEPIEIDTDDDGIDETYYFYEIRGRCGSIALKSYVGEGFNLIKYFTYFREWQKDPDFIIW